MGLRTHESNLPQSRFGLRGFLTAWAVLAAIALAFALGLIIARDVWPLPAHTIAVVALAAACLVVAQTAVQLIILLRAARTEALTAAAMHDLASRNDQIWLLGRLCNAVGGECRYRRLAGRALDFLVEDLGASAATYWKADINGEPVKPVLARPTAERVSPAALLAEAERTILCRSAARRSLPIIAAGASGQPKPLDIAAPPAAPFVLFLPLSAAGVGHGVIEIEANGASWPPHRWKIMGLLASQVGLALERGRQYEEMQQQADEDFTTGLYNPRFMQTYLQRLLALAQRRGRKMAVLFLDVDDFKAINDSLGHGAGDRVLQAVAGQLRMMTDRVGVVGRSGGDEFMVVLPDHTRSEAEAFVQAFQDWLAQGPRAINGLFRLRVSCGPAVFPDDAGNRQELLAVADARLYRAKDRGRAAKPPHNGNGPGEQTLGVYGLLDRIVDSIHSKDNYTRVHCEWTAEYAVLLAQKLGLSPSAQRTLRLAGLLHDVGKIGVPEEILRKPGPLNADEFEIIKHQVSIAGYLIVDIPNADDVRRAVRHNHERWDGSGYPDGLKGEDIPYLARVLAVADAYAALTLDRPYRDKVPGGQAYGELQAAAGTQLDPELVRAFAGAVPAETKEELRPGIASPVR